MLTLVVWFFRFPYSMTFLYIYLLHLGNNSRNFFFDTDYDTEENAGDIILFVKSMNCTNYLTFIDLVSSSMKGVWAKQSLTFLPPRMWKDCVHHCFLIKLQICIINIMFHFPWRLRKPSPRGCGWLIFVNISLHSTFKNFH